MRPRFLDDTRVICGGAARSFVEPLAAGQPAEQYTVYVAAPLPSSGKAALVEQLIGHLRAPHARERLASTGYTLPE